MNGVLPLLSQRFLIQCCGWTHQCLWARAIIPGDWIPGIEYPDYIELDTWESPNFSELVAAVGKGYTDRAGGPKDVAEIIKQVSFGAVVSEFEEDNEGAAVIKTIGAMGGQVPGKQTAES